jgi:uncharacterized alkaline shock family protein YloU
MDDQAVISDEVLARYAADAAADVTGVSLHGGKPVVASVEDGGIRLTAHVELEWGRRAEQVASALQEQVRDYVERMTRSRVVAVNVVVDRVGGSSSS